MDEKKGIAELGGYELWGQGPPALIFWGVSMLMLCCSAIFVINDDYGTFILCFLVPEYHILYFTFLTNPILKNATKEDWKLN